MNNLSHIFAKRAESKARWTRCEERVQEAVASFENGATKDGIAHLCHALVTNDRPDPETMQRLFREVTDAAGAFGN